MKRAFFLSLLASFAVLAYGQSAYRFVPGQVIVRFNPNTQIAERALNLRLGARVIGSVNELNVRVLSLPSSLGVDKAVQEYSRQSIVRYAEPNIIRDYLYTPNDPRYSQQYAHQRIKSYLAWDITMGSPTVKIAILDSGCDVTHPDLQAQMLPGWDFVNNDPNPEDDVGHGTHVAGCASAATDNGIGVAGVGFRCKIVPVKVGGAYGIPTSAVIAGLTWAANQGVQVINMSFGGPFPSSSEEDAVNYAWNHGVVLCASAGNTPTTDKLYPAAFENCIAIAASNQYDQKADFSTYGPWVDVASPGVAILSTTVGGGYEAWDGTSMASPVCAGAVGLIWSVASEFTNTQIRALLENNCDNVGNWVVNGRINAYKAVLAAPIYDLVPISATAAWVSQGTYIMGNELSFPRVDGLYYRAGTVYQRAVGNVALINVNYQTDPLTSQVKLASLNVNAQGVAGSTGMIYLWDWTRGEYVWQKSFPMSATSASTTVSLNLSMPLSKWFNSSGLCKIALRALTPQRMAKPFQFSVDRSEIVLKVRRT